MGQELLDLHQAYSKGAMTVEEYESAKLSILRNFGE
jgi:hypothetical protein